MAPGRRCAPVLEESAEVWTPEAPALVSLRVGRGLNSDLNWVLHGGCPAARASGEALGGVRVSLPGSLFLPRRPGAPSASLEPGPPGRSATVCRARSAQARSPVLPWVAAAKEGRGSLAERWRGLWEQGAAAGACRGAAGGAGGAPGAPGGGGGKSRGWSSFARQPGSHQAASRGALDWGSSLGWRATVRAPWAQEGAAAAGPLPLLCSALPCSCRAAPAALSAAPPVLSCRGGVVALGFWSDLRLSLCFSPPRQVWFQNRRSKERRMKQLSALGARRHAFFRSPRRMRPLVDRLEPGELIPNGPFSFYGGG